MAPVKASITDDDVRHVARLARLGLDEEEVGRFKAQLAQVLELIEQIQAIDLAGVAPMDHVDQSASRLRADEPEPSLGPAGLAHGGRLDAEHQVVIPPIVELEA
jgi:aspartyl-tRNA(Asn)/glutamyl-tRNA(Gln) amidotransferase subunit C